MTKPTPAKKAPTDNGPANGQATDNAPDDIAALAAKATTSAEWQRVGFLAERGLKAAQQHLADLKANRAEFVFGGGDVDGRSREILAAGEAIETWRDAKKVADERWEAALEVEGTREMEREAAEAKKLVPELEAAWLAHAKTLAAVKTSQDDVEAIERKIDELQAKARRAKRKDLLVSFHAVRAAAAEKCPRPTLGPDAVNVLQEDDNIKRAGLLAANVCLQFAVHYRDEHAARRNNVLVTALPGPPDKGPIVRAVDPEGGRKIGGIGRGVS